MLVHNLFGNWDHTVSLLLVIPTFYPASYSGMINGIIWHNLKSVKSYILFWMKYIHRIKNDESISIRRVSIVSPPVG